MGSLIPSPPQIHTYKPSLSLLLSLITDSSSFGSCPLFPGTDGPDRHILLRIFWILFPGTHHRPRPVGRSLISTARNIWETFISWWHWWIVWRRASCQLRVNYYTPPLPPPPPHLKNNTWQTVKSWSCSLLGFDCAAMKVYDLKVKLWRGKSEKNQNISWIATFRSESQAWLFEWWTMAYPCTVAVGICGDKNVR